MSDRDWIVYTDLDPQTLSQVGLAVFELWVKFAMGQDQIQGYQLKHPTGRYASSIFKRNLGPYRVAIISDEKMAPEGIFLEEGHAEIDLKEINKLKGRVIPMHEGSAGVFHRKTGSGPFTSAGYGAPIRSRHASARAKNIWAQPKAQGASGFARIPSKRTAANAQSWIIPEMKAMSPAANLVDLLKRGAFQR